MRQIRVAKEPSLRIELKNADIAEGVLLDFSGTDFEKGHIVLQLTHKKETSVSGRSPLPPRRIPGHPNCYYGDCSDCHVVSCAIHQGFVEEPNYDECEEINE